MNANRTLLQPDRACRVGHGNASTNPFTDETQIAKNIMDECGLARSQMKVLLEHGSALDVKRSRPDLLIAAANDASFAQDEWVGRVLKIGRLRMRVDKRDGRCAVITLDPETSRKEPGVLRAVAPH